MTNESESAELEYSGSIRMSAPLVDKIMAQCHETPDDADVRRLMHAVRKEKDDDLKVSFPVKTQRVVDLACEKGASSWLIAIPLKDINLDLSKRKFRDVLRLRYDWPIPESPSSVCVCGCSFTVDYVMICKRGGLIIQRDNEIRGLKAELLDMVCYAVAIEPTLQPFVGEELNSRANSAPDVRLDVHCRGFRKRQGAAFFDIRVCHANADSYKELSPNNI